MTNDIQRKSLEFYLKLKYPIKIIPDVTGGYVAEIEDLPGCFTQGETLEETYENMEEVRQLWLIRDREKNPLVGKASRRGLYRL